MDFSFTPAQDAFRTELRANGCHCWLVQQCYITGTLVPDRYEAFIGKRLAVSFQQKQVWLTANS